MMKLKKIIGLFMLIITIIPTLTPMVVNGQEVVKAEAENMKQIAASQKEKKIKKIDPTINSNDVKNTAYGCSGTSCDNSTDYMRSNKYLLENFEYKINAITHEITINFTSKYNFLNAADENFLSIKVTDGIKPVLEITSKTADITANKFKQLPHTTGDYQYMATTGDLSTFANEGQYALSMAYGNSKDGFDLVKIPTPEGKNDYSELIKINVPKTYKKDGKTYSLIGDDVNYNTDFTGVSSSEEAITSLKADKQEEGTTGKEVSNYGVYELESILYDGYNDGTTDVNGTSNFKSNNLQIESGEWDPKTDLTLSKYDHVVRPNNGNYIIADNIDAVLSKTKQEADNLGGFDKDGYRSIGQKTNTTDGKNSLPFTGEITGDIDTLLSKTENNTYISNLYINQPTYLNVGMVAVADAANLNNLGIVDPEIIADSNVGTIAGITKDSDLTDTKKSELLNVYALESKDDSTGIKYDINAKGDMVGGLVGNSADTDIYSDGRFDAKIPGIDLSTDSQPSRLPDKDGYKTFNTVDVKSAGARVAGIVGNSKNTNVSFAYNKGTINSSSISGGIVGLFNNGSIKNTYNYGGISSASYAGGIGGSVAGAAVDDIIAENSYNKGRILLLSDSNPYSGGGIFGSLKNATVKNTYNNATVEGESASNVGGILGNVGDGNDYHILNAFNLGTIKGTKNIGGIIGLGSNQINNVENVINLGSINGDGANPTIGGVAGDISTAQKTTLKNTYNYDGAKITNGTRNDSNIGRTGYTIISGLEINQPSFWTDKLFVDDNGANWNINASDVGQPVPDSDSKDESADDDKGTVNRSYTPTIKEIDKDGKITKLEVPEQTLKKIPLNSEVINNYKINAMNLDLSLNYTLSNEVTKAIKKITNGSLDMNFVVRDSAGTEILRSGTINPKDGTYELGLASKGKIKQDSDYTIALEYSGVKLGNTLSIHTPKQLIKNGKTYALVGDGVNKDTYVDGLEADTTKANPTITKDVYGVFELESILYDGTTTIDGTSNFQMNNNKIDSGEWNTTKDLTISKYDHIVRPNNGNYLIANSIDAKETQSNRAIDSLGGFNKDGFRSIGQLLTTTTGNDSLPFTGEITGDIDTLLSKTEDNTYISSLFINQPTLNNIALLSQTDAARINNFGMVDPTITGLGNVAAFVGKAVDSDTTDTKISELKNVYGTTVKNVDPILDSKLPFNIVGLGNTDSSSEYSTAAIIASANNTNVISDGRFIGAIPGMKSYDAGDQSKLFPDRDGYKTFNTLDVKGSNAFTGGIVGKLGTGVVNRVYNKGDIQSVGTENGKNTAGIVAGSQGNDLTVSSVYNYGHIRTDSNDVTSNASGIFANGDNDNIKVNNVYNGGLIEGNNASGIAGDLEGMIITNVYNYGTIKPFVQEYKTTKSPVSANGIAYGTMTSTKDRVQKLKNAYNFGTIDTTGVDTDKVTITAAGISSHGFNATVGTGEYTVENTFSGGEFKMPAGLKYYASVKDPLENGFVTKIHNTYANENLEDFALDTERTQLRYISAKDINTPSWWKNTLFVDDNGANWNIEAGDAIIPSPDNDTTDESRDDNLGTVASNKYPTVKEVDEDNKLTKMEVPEQKLANMPKQPFDKVDYKINASNLDMTLFYHVSELTYKKYFQSRVTAKNIVINDPDGNTVIRQPVTLKVGNNEAFVKNLDKSSATGQIKPDTDYSIYIEVNGAKLKSLLTKVHTPKLLPGADNDYSTSDDNYIPIGDGINKNTYIKGFSPDTTKANPTITGNKYGIYELESLVYDGTSKIGGISGFKSDDGIIQNGEWDETKDLTISKYDHIIRPNTANYYIATDIDGSATKTNTQIDTQGGFGTDGFQAIGHFAEAGRFLRTRINMTGENPDGSGVNDNKQDNSIISNVYINKPEDTYVALVAVGDNIHINNLGIVDPDFTGGSEVASLVAYASVVTKIEGRQNEFLNVYAGNSANDGKVNIKANKDRSGGLIGDLNTGTIISDSNFTGVPRGINPIDETGKVINNGYKTLNTLNVTSEGIQNAGGLVARAYDATIDKVYNTGDVSSPVGAGGILSAVHLGSDTDRKTVNITNCDNYGDINTADGNVGGILGYVAYSEGASILNLDKCSNKGNVSAHDTINNTYGDNVGGIVGQFRIDKTMKDISHVQNSYNYGDIEGGISVGGIVGYAENPLLNTEVGPTDPYMISINNNYSVGSINKNIDKSYTGEFAYIGGIVGGGRNVQILNNYANMDLSGDDRVSGIVGEFFTELDGLTGYNTLRNNYFIGKINIMGGLSVIDAGTHSGGIIGANPYGETTDTYISLIVENNYANVKFNVEARIPSQGEIPSSNFNIGFIGGEDIGNDPTDNYKNVSFKNNYYNENSSAYFKSDGKTLTSLIRDKGYTRDGVEAQGGVSDNPISVAASAITSSSWWKDTLFAGVAKDYDNYNLTASTLTNYPHLYQVGTKTEVSEQPNIAIGYTPSSKDINEEPKKTTELVEQVEEVKDTTDINQLQKDSDSLSEALNLDEEDNDILLDKYDELTSDEKTKVKLFVEYIKKEYSKDPNKVLEYKNELQNILESTISEDKNSLLQKLKEFNDKIKNDI